MDEILPSSTENKCSSCPNRSLISRKLAQLAGTNSVAEGCEGPVHLEVGIILSETINASEPWPNRRTWNRMTQDGETASFSRTKWLAKKVCGREEIILAQDEIPYGKELIRAQDGEQYATIISGNEQQLKDHKAHMGTIALLDSVN